MEDLIYALVDFEYLLILLETYLASFIVAGSYSFVIYILHAFIRMKMGQKAGLGDEWQAWVPFAQEIYLTKLADVPRWKIIFFGSYIALISGIIYGISVLCIALDWENILYGEVGAGLILTILLAVLCLAYVIWALVENVKTYIKLYKNFKNTGSAFTVAAIIGIFVNSLGIIIADAIIAFNDKYTYAAGKSVSKIDGKVATITGVSGIYKGQSFDIADGDNIFFGRDPECCNVIFPASETAVSRRHCSIKYIGMSDNFLVTNYSKNGVFYGEGQKIEAGASRMIQKGSVISVGTTANQFILG